MLWALAATLGVSSCKEEPLPAVPDAGQLVAGRLDGTWANPTNIVTPEEVPAEVFGSMRLVFTTDESGQPSEFLARDCPIVFSGTAGAWAVSGNESDGKVTLTGVTPVDEFDIKVSSASLTISFHMGWENTDTGEKGRGDFRVTLARQ